MLFWTATTKRRIAAIAAAWLLIAATALALAGRWESSGTPVAHHDSKVLIFGIPHLGFRDLSPRTTPTLWRLIHTDGAIAATSVRSQHTRPGTLEGYAALGAGSRVAAPQRPAGLAVAADAPAGGGRTAGEALAARTGVAPDGDIVVPSGIGVLRANIGRHNASVAGALGTTLRRAGRRTAVVSNADIEDLATGRWRQFRPAALALMDNTLAVSTGQVDRRLLRPARFVSATIAALRHADAVVADPGEMDRAAAFADQALPVPGAAARRAALHATDAVLGRTIRGLPKDTLLLVVSVSPPPTYGLTPTVAAGPGVVRGTLSSPSTKRDGVVTITDLAPTVLSALGVPAPAGMVGHPLTVTPGRPGLRRFEQMDARSVTTAHLYAPAIIVYLIVTGLLFAVVIAMTLVGARPRRGALRLAALTVAACPLATYLIALVPGARAASVAVEGAVMAALAVAVAALCAWLGRSREHPLAALIWLLGFTIAVPVVDVIAGGPLHQSTLLGFSLPGGGRFYGWPNGTFALVGSAALLFCALLVDRYGRRGDVLAVCIGVLALVVLVDGSPSLGADVGGILALVPIYALFAVALVGGRLTRRAWLLAGLTTVAVLGLAVAVDLLQPLGARTDIADFASGLFGSGTHGATTTITRKVSVNFAFIGHTVWTWMLPIVVVFGAWALASPDRRARLVPASSPLRIGVIAVGVLAILGFLVNDSGPLVIALALSFVGPLFVLLLAEPQPPGAGDHHRRSRLQRTSRRAQARRTVEP
jgi:hypothetical protein